MKAILSLIRNEQGAAGAEMALMVPMLLVLMFGSFEMGHYFWSEHKVVKAVRDGSRFAARQSFVKFSCSEANILLGDGSTNADTAYITQVKNLTRTGNIAGTGNPKVYGWTNAQITVSVSCPATPVNTGIYKGLTNAPRVTVAATVPYPSLFGTLGFDATAINLNAQSQSSVMGI
jgi:Flp pilus assembly protein TadG